MMTINPRTADDLKKLADAGLLEGVFDSIPSEAYHAGPGLSFTGLKEFSITPMHFKAYTEEPHDPTPAMIRGTLTHLRVLEPKKFDATVVSVPNRVQKENKEKIAEAEACGKTVCTTKEYDEICRIADSVWKNDEARQFLSHKDGRAEVSCWQKDPKTGALLKGRADWFIDSSTFVLADLKTTSHSLDERELRKQVFNSKYHWQAAFYLKLFGLALGKTSNLFANIFVETSAPYGVRVVVLDDASLEKAEFDFAPLIEQYAGCLSLDEWPGYPPGILTTSIPEYAWN